MNTSFYANTMLHAVRQMYLYGSTYDRAMRERQREFIRRLAAKIIAGDYNA